MGTIGIEWVNKYHGRGKDLKNRDNCARGFYNNLNGVKQFEYSDDLAWDQDFEESGVGSPTAGTDQIYADNVDIIYFAGHGGPSGISFGRTNKDDGTARNTNIRLGDRQCEWIVFDACSTLSWSGNVFDRWRQIFTGLHMILGFENTAYDRSDRGEKFAKKLNAGKTLYRAWREACEETEGSDVNWCVLYVNESNTDTYNDHWHGKGYVSPDPDNHTSGTSIRGPC